MEDIKTEVLSCIPIHPGIVLRDLLDERQMSQKNLAVTLGKPTPIINDIIQGKRNINAEISVLLETVIPDIPAQEWLKLQAQYDIYKIKEEDGIKKRGKLISTWNSLNELLNISILKKKLHLSDNLEESIHTLYSTFGIDDVTELTIRSNNIIEYFRKSDASLTDNRNLLTWLCLVRYQSANDTLSNKKFNKDNILQITAKLNDILYQNEDTINKTIQILNEIGIKFYVIEKLDKVPVDGFSFWEGDNPTIVLTTRYNRIDNYAFTLFHELGHLFLHFSNNNNGDEFLDDTTQKDKYVSSKEKEANEFAINAMWNNCNYKELFNAISSPFAAGPFLQSISQKKRINIGIITGQYQHYCAENCRCRTPYAICRKLIEQIK